MNKKASNLINAAIAPHSTGLNTPPGISVQPVTPSAALANASQSLQNNPLNPKLASFCKNAQTARTRPSSPAEIPLQSFLQG